MVAGPLVIALLVFWMAGWTGGLREHAGIVAIETIVWGGAWSGTWLIAAWGLGLPLRLVFAREADDALALQFALGVCAMVWLDATLGRLGVLQLGGSLGGWSLLAVGGLLAIWQSARWLVRRERRPVVVPPFLIWAAAPSIAVLLLAAASAPGILWSSEFGGYDALSYHLQLPREWMSLGRIVTLEHNVYSFLPSFIESAFYHLDVVIGGAPRHPAARWIGGHGGPQQASFACQMLHAWMTLAAAWLVASVARRRGGRLGGCVAGVILIGTPWSVVTGSLAYNDMAVAMLLAAGLLALEQPRMVWWKLAVIIGGFAGAACGAKLTAAGFVALPLVAMLMWKLPARKWLAAIPACALAATFALSPWLVGNAIASGNPVFPFAAELFGTGHWSDEQAAIWRGGHAFHGTASARMNAGWTELMRYGLGDNPDADGVPAANDGDGAGSSPTHGPSKAGPHGSWQPQWSLLPWLAIVGLTFGLCRPETRRHAMQLGTVLLIQLLFWLLFTHIKSRFMVPATVPMALLVALPLSTRPTAVACRRVSPISAPGHRPGASAAAQLLVAAALLAWSSLPVVIFSREQGGAPAQGVALTSLFTGEHLDPLQRQALSLVLPTVYVNHELPPQSRVLLIGDATPFYYTRPVTYQTTWDRGPMSEIVRQSRDDETAWIAQLRRDGFTHVLVNPTMLDVWTRAGWNDPALTATRLIDGFERSARRIGTFDRGERLYAVD